MCTYQTEVIPAAGSAKGAPSWFRITDAVVYFDHPVHALTEHSLNIDFSAPAAGPGARVAVELTAETARELVAAIERALASAGELAAS
jgi:hypothetical protein